MLLPSGTGPDGSPITRAERWQRVRDSGVGMLAWLVVIAIGFWLIGHVIRALLLLVIGALLAYALHPVITRLARRMPRWLAITIVYVLALALLGGLGYLIVSTAAAQVGALAQALPRLLRGGVPSFLASLLGPFGVTQAQIDAVRAQLVTYAEGVAGTVASQAIPIATGVANFLLDTLLIVVISIYLVIDGQRLVAWVGRSAPVSQRPRVDFLLATLERTGGGYIRGQLFMSSLIGVLVGAGMFALQVPYALLLGVLAFILEFIPMIGTITSGAICVLIALTTRGLVWSVVVLAYFVVVHIIEGDWIGPRVIGRVLGLHPIVAMLALIVGADLFGVFGALFAGPVAGILQAIVVAAWNEWRAANPRQFAEVPDPPPLPPPASGEDGAASSG
ncbi:MAG TPA: AI-2E family transporter [Ktedonobacterales bacterium]|nr:AI-2E family transporter [Ktedonobacterales bacterium]